MYPLDLRLKLHVPLGLSETSCLRFQRQLSLLAVSGYILLCNRAINNGIPSLYLKKLRTFIPLTGKAVQHEIYYDGRLDLPNLFTPWSRVLLEKLTSKLCS